MIQPPLKITFTLRFLLIVHSKNCVPAQRDDIWLKEEKRSKNTIEKYLRDVRAPVTVNAKQLARPYK